MTVADDFENGPLVDFGVSVTRTPVTVAKGNIRGQKTYSDGTPASITVVFLNPNQNFALDKPGLTEICDAKMIIKAAETLNKHDKITHNSKVYRVDKISARKFAGTTGFKSVLLFFIS